MSLAFSELEHEEKLSGAETVESREITGMPLGFYNAAAWTEGTQTLLLGRHLNAPGAPGEGDPGPLLLVVVEADTVISTEVLWRPESADKKGDQLEDVRVVVGSDGNLTLGCTRLVYNHADSRYEPFPALAFTSSQSLLRGEFPDTHTIEKLGKGDDTTPLGEEEAKPPWMTGKNATPLGHQLDIHKFMYRQEIHNHTLTVVLLDEKNKAEVWQELEFPEDQIPWWGRDRMGTTMPPVWLNDSEALFFVHGFRLVEGKPQYAIGSARLFVDSAGKYHIDNVSPEPLLTPQGLSAELFPGQDVQLHPEERQAIYMCGGVVKYDQAGEPKLIHGYPSVGDSRTIESTFYIKALTNQWTPDRPLS